jgi:uncharacterized protein (TIGR02145 family)
MRSVILSFRFLLLLIIILFSCKKEDKIKPPIVETKSITNIAYTSALSGGNIKDDGMPIISRGVCWSTSISPTIADSISSDGDGAGSFVSFLVGLNPNTMYYVRAYATNSEHISYGAEISFITLALQIPEVTTSEVRGISSKSAICGGYVTFDGGCEIDNRGVCWSTNVNPSIRDNKTSDGKDTGVFSSTITGLSGNTKYYLRSYATSKAGTGYGLETSFITSPTVSDIGGNVYSTVTIGSQLWMAENLKTKFYNDGTPILYISRSDEWVSLSIPAYCWYNNKEPSVNHAYGALYNWYSVNTGKLCPKEWHVPSDTEWKILEMYLGMSQMEADDVLLRGSDQGYKLKSTSGWFRDRFWDGNGSNISGFTALPGGNRETGDWWSSTSENPDKAWFRGLSWDWNFVLRLEDNIRSGYSVRCIRDF